MRIKKIIFTICLSKFTDKFYLFAKKKKKKYCDSEEDDFFVN